jgi:hypothetical protein
MDSQEPGGCLRCVESRPRQFLADGCFGAEAAAVRCWAFRKRRHRMRGKSRVCSQSICGVIYKFFSKPSAQETVSLFQSILSGNTLMAADPRTFNDPFECKVVLDLDAPIEVRKERFRKDQPHASEEECASWLRTLDTSRWWVEQNTRAEILASHGIASFTLDWRNELLWAHYAKDHTGFCIGFDEAVLTRWSEVSDSGAVEYTEDCPVFRFFEETPADFVRKVAFHKSKSWDYEREFRLLFERSDLLRMPLGAIQEVTVGCRASSQLRNAARTMLGNHELGIYQAYELPRKFRIERQAMKEDSFLMTSHF